MWAFGMLAAKNAQKHRWWTERILFVDEQNLLLRKSFRAPNASMASCHQSSIWKSIVVSSILQYSTSKTNAQLNQKQELHFWAEPTNALLSWKLQLHLNKALFSKIDSEWTKLYKNRRTQYVESTPNFPLAKHVMERIESGARVNTYSKHWSFSQHYMWSVSIIYKLSRYAKMVLFSCFSDMWAWNKLIKPHLRMLVLCPWR